MAAKRKKPNTSVKKKGRTPSFKSEKLKFIFGVLILLLAAYLLIAFISFLFFGNADQSKFDLNWKEFVLNPEIQVQNKAGKTGAWLSEVIINQGFGLASFIFIYLMIIFGFRVLGKSFLKFRKNFMRSMFLLIWLSITLGFIFTKTDGATALYPGGKYGFILSAWLSSMLGTSVVALLIIIIALIFLTVRFDGFLPLLKKIFTRRKNKNYGKSEIEVGGDEIIVDNTISKIIDDDDIIRTIFEPDADDDNLTIEKVSNQEPEFDGEINPELIFHEKAEGDDMDDELYEEMEEYDPTLDLSDFKFPTMELLEDHNSGNAEVSNEELISNKNKIVETLRHYKIEITKIRATIGPTITLYEIVPAPGIRIAKIKNLEDDIALSLAALGIRIIAPIPGRGTIGIEVPNQNPEVVSMRMILSSKKFQESAAELPVALGKTISNETFMFDLVKMPHILVAGATGQGKSVGVNVIITSLLYKKHPSQLKFVFIDPKKVELNLYSVLEKHYLAKLPGEGDPVITDIQKVKYTLNSINVEMDQRYELLKKAHARNVKEYNQKFISRRLNPEKGHRYMPYIVVIIDEFADLIMTAGKEIELPIARIAQLARAVGIHMVIATQRPSTNIITGVIKANFPARVAFKVASMIDSRTILDTPGANQLIGKGDMLISSGSSITRVQCAFIDTPEVEKICSFISEQRGYPTAFLLPEYVGDDEPGLGKIDLNDKDEFFDDAARVVVMNQMGSTSMIQRKFAIGYNRAGRIMDQLEAAGVVGPSEGSKARQVIIQDEYTLEQLLNSLN